MEAMMLLKEKGYDEFLAQNLAKGRAELEAGKGISLAEAKLQVQATIVETVKDLDDLEKTIAYA